MSEPLTREDERNLKGGLAVWKRHYAELEAERDTLRAQLEQSKNLQRLTLDNEIRWMQKHEQSERFLKIANDKNAELRAQLGDERETKLLAVRLKLKAQEENDSLRARCEQLVSDLEKNEATAEEEHEEILRLATRCEQLEAALRSLKVSTSGSNGCVWVEGTLPGQFGKIDLLEFSTIASETTR